MCQLEIVQNFVATEQQEKAYLKYEEEVVEFGRHPGRRDFIEFYKLWCKINKKPIDFTIEQLN